MSYDFFKPGGPLDVSMSGKYMGFSGFPTGVSLGKNLTEPLSQQTNSASASSFNPVDYYKSLEGLPESTRNSLLLQEVNNRSSNKIGEDYALLKILDKFSDPLRQKETLNNQLAYDKARMKEAFPYLMAREIPRQISEGFANQSALNILGARSAVDAMNQTLQAYPRMTFQTSAFNPQKYLS
jgi:hypothetical protein